MKQLWRQIEGYEWYQVSNTGLMKSIGRKIVVNRRSCLYERHQKKIILKPYLDKDGYKTVQLYDEQKRMKHFRVSRLVAKAFIANPMRFPEVNHKDLDRTNDSVENLEWCSQKYNVNYKDAPIRSGLKRRNNKSQSKPIVQYTKSGLFVREFPSIIEAKRLTGINASHICQTCLGNYKSAGGYIWKYK